MKLYEIEFRTDIDETYNYMQRMWGPDGYDMSTLLGKMGKYEVRYIIPNGNYFDYLFALYDPTERECAVFLMVFSFKKNKNTLITDHVGCHENYKGLNLPVKLYSWLILNKNFIFMSGNTQSPGGANIWKQLSKIPNILVAGYNIPKNNLFQIDMDEIETEGIYSSEQEEEIKYLEKEIVEQEKLGFPDKQYWDQLENDLAKLEKEKDKTDSIRLVAMKGKK